MSLATAAKALLVDRKMSALDRYRQLLTTTDDDDIDPLELIDVLETLGLAPADFDADQRAVQLLPTHESDVVNLQDAISEARVRREAHARELAECRQVRLELMAGLREQIAIEQRVVAQDAADAATIDAAENDVHRLGREVNRLRRNHPRAFGG